MPKPTSDQDTAALDATLLPCPHCGPMPAAPELVLSDVSKRWQVFCGPCGSSSGSSKDPQGAADGWNSRSTARPSIPHSSPALVQLALMLGNSVADLSPNTAAPIYGFSSDEKRLQAFGLARAIVAALNATGHGEASTTP